VNVLLNPVQQSVPFPIIMNLSFTKMHGLGNDFVVINAISQTVDLTPGQIRFIADRHRGVGCDQLLLVEPPETDEVDFSYRIFNADGGEVGQCGNGARCFARYVVNVGLTDKSELAVATASGVIRLSLQADGQVTADMGAPRFNPADIPFDADVEEERFSLSVGGQQIEIGAVSMGNPHAVIDVASLDVTNVDDAPVAELGPLLESHSRFPERVNVGFMQVVARDHIRLRVFERGVGETQACGTGACAAVAVARTWRMVDDEVSVDLPGGQLLIRWQGGSSAVFMTGPAETVFEGTISI
jgi:diaminopimelate epimerase